MSYFQSFFLLTVFLTVGGFMMGYITVVFKDNMSLRRDKTAEIMVYFNFFACQWKDPDPEPDPYK
jgi:hypothetical protein